MLEGLKAYQRSKTDAMRVGLRHLRKHEFTNEAWSNWLERGKPVWFYDRFPMIKTWKGQSIKDKTILLWYEQGLGDQLLFIYTAQLLKSEKFGASRVICEVDKRLVSLLTRSFPDVEFIPYQYPWDEVVYEADFECALGDVMCYTTNSWEDFPFVRQQLIPDAGLVKHFKEKYAGHDLVGVAWASGAQHGAKNKSLDPKLYRKLAESSTCLSLQYGNTSTPDYIVVDDEVNLTTDMEGVAALIEACSHVVTTSNTVAHMAGGVGVPTDVMLPQGMGRHWYWYAEVSPNPFYFNCSVHMQSIPGYYNNLIDKIAKKRLDIQ